MEWKKEETNQSKNYYAKNFLDEYDSFVDF